MKFRRTVPLSIGVLVILGALVFAQSGPVVEKMPKSKNFDIPEDLDDSVKKLLKECETEMEQRLKDIKNFKEHQDKMMKAAKKAAQKAPKCALAQFYLCIGYQGEDKDNLALKAIDKGLKLKPDFYELEVERADILVREEKEDKALKIYDKVIEEHPDYYYTYEAKFSFMLKQKKWKEALEMLNKILSHPHLERLDKNLKEFKPILESEVKGLNLPIKAEGPHYIVDTDVSQEYADFILKHAETIWKAYNKVFKSNKMKKGEKFPITIFANRQSYLNYGGPPQSAGFFHPTLQRVVFIKSSREGTFTNTLYHELFHQFLSAQKVALPYWFNEGHADFFGGFKLDEAKNQMVCYTNSVRTNTIRQAVQSGRAAPLSQLITMTRDEYYNPQTMGRNYAQGWSFVYFLWRAENGKYTRYVKKYFSLMKKKKYSLKEMYQKVFARNIGTIEQAWQAFVRRGFK